MALLFIPVDILPCGDLISGLVAKQLHCGLGTRLFPTRIPGISI